MPGWWHNQRLNNAISNHSQWRCKVDYIPKKITLGVKQGLDAETMLALRNLAEQNNVDPRTLAAELLKEAIVARVLKRGEPCHA